MTAYPFDEKELIPVRQDRLFYMPPQAPGIDVFRYPCDCKTAYKQAYKDRKPIWALTGIEGSIFAPRIIPDNVARGSVVGALPPVPETEYGGYDMFGVKWEWVPQVRGSMVRPGHPLMEDANDWKQVLKFPTKEEIDSWGWEQSARDNREFLARDKAYVMVMFTGCWYERLISSLEEQKAAVALIDEEQQAAVHEILDKTTELYCYLVDKIADTYGEGVSGIQIHDDWGTQRAPFFSPETARKMLVPHMKQLTAKIHERGMAAEIHSCGCNAIMVPCYIEAGWDIWTAQSDINDTVALAEQYGGQITIMVQDDYDPAGQSEEEQYQAGCRFAQKLCRPGVPVYYNYWSPSKALTPAYRKGFYAASRKIYQDM